MFSVLIGLALLAQQPDIEALRLRVDSLRAIERVQRAARDRADSIRRAQRLEEGAGSLDTVLVAGFSVVARDKSVDRIARLFEEVWRERGAALLGPDALNNTVFVVQDRNRFGALDALKSRDHHHAIVLAREPWQRSAQVWVALASVYSGKLSPQLREWLEGASIGRDARSMREAVYRQIALQPNTAAQQCLQGNAQRCLDALGLRDAGARFERRYTPDELRAYVLGGNRARQHLLRAHPCFANRNDNACLELITNPTRLIPMSADARISFFDFLLKRAGPTAFGRLQAVQELPVEQQLAALAPGGLEQAANEWRQQIATAEPNRLGASLAVAGSTLFWVLLLAAAGTRSTRWRLA